MNPMLDISHDGQASLPAQDSAEPSSWTRRGLTVTHAIEVLAAFAIGAAVMSFVYVDTRGISSQVNSLPGYDSWYHTKMAALLPEIGLVDDFPWLKFVYFKREGHDFVSHHTGFHAFLMPLVHLAKKWTGDYAPGARWAMSICFGLVLMLICWSRPTWVSAGNLKEAAIASSSVDLPAPLSPTKKVTGVSKRTTSRVANKARLKGNLASGS